MMVVEWFRQRQVEKLQIRLAEVEAEIAADQEAARKTGKIFPVAAASQAREKAGIQKRLEILARKSNKTACTS